MCSLERRRAERRLAGAQQGRGKVSLLGKRGGLEQVVRDFARTLLWGARMEAFDGMRDVRVQSLATRQREPMEQGLAQDLVCEGERRLGALRARHQQAHLLRLLDGVAELIDVDLIEEQSKELEAEAPADHRGRCQYLPLGVAESIETATDDQANVLRHVDLVAGDVRAKLAGGIEHPAVFDE